MVLLVILVPSNSSHDIPFSQTELEAIRAICYSLRSEGTGIIGSPWFHFTIWYNLQLHKIYYNKVIVDNLVSLWNDGHKELYFSTQNEYFVNYFPIQLLNNKKKMFRHKLQWDQLIKMYSFKIVFRGICKKHWFILRLLT